MRLIRFYFLNKIIKDPVVSAQVYNLLYRKGEVPKKELSVPPRKNTKITEVKSKSVSDLRTALQELKSKNNKSKQDKESIGILEAAIKNGY